MFLYVKSSIFIALVHTKLVERWLLKYDIYDFLKIFRGKLRFITYKLITFLWYYLVFHVTSKSNLK